MATVRHEIKNYIGQWIPIRADVTSRSDGGQYGFLLQGIQILDPAEGIYLDHVWVKIYDLDLAAVSGETITAEAYVSEYYSEHSVRHGGVGYGIGFSSLRNVSVVLEDGTMPLAEAATLFRQAHRASIKKDKESGNYIYPGVWTFKTGKCRVKAAKSAKPGSPCDVRSKSGDITEVILVEHLGDGVWRHELKPLAPAVSKRRRVPGVSKHS